MNDSTGVWALLSFGAASLTALAAVTAVLRWRFPAPDAAALQAGAISFLLASLIVGSGLRVTLLALGFDVTLHPKQALAVTLSGLALGAACEEVFRAGGLWRSGVLRRGASSIHWFALGYGSSELLLLLFAAFSAGVVSYAGMASSAVTLTTDSPFVAAGLGGLERLSALLMQLVYTLAAAVSLQRRRFYLIPVLVAIHAACNGLAIEAGRHGEWALAVVMLLFLGVATLASQALTRSLKHEALA